MSKRLNAKYKIDRRYGENLWGRAKSPVNKRETVPGQHGVRKKSTDYGIQLSAKQKLKGYYGNVSEKQMRRYFAEAIRRKGDTGENLVGILESRLDAVVYRMKLVPTVFASRQFINHGHVLVNGQKVNIPSYMVKAGDEISITNKAKEMALVIESMASQERNVPDYIQIDEKSFSGKYIQIPALADIPYAVEMQPSLVVEFYSR